MSPTTTTTPVTTEIDLPADADEVWALLTTDEGFASWSGDGATIDAQPGGPLHTPDAATGTPRVGAVEEVVESERLRYRWWPVDEPDLVSTVDITLIPSTTGTRVTITERLAAPITNTLSANTLSTNNLPTTDPRPTASVASGHWSRLTFVRCTA